MYVSYLYNSKGTLMVWIDPYVPSLIFMALAIGVALWIVFNEYLYRRRGITEAIRHDEQKARKVRITELRKRFIKFFVMGAVAAFVAVNLATWAISAFSSPAGRTGNYQEAAANFGLEAGAEYPLIIGGSASGATVGNVHYGRFSATTADLRPATTVNLSFGYEQNSWITTISTELITFHVDNDKPASVSMEFSPYSYGTQSTWDNLREGSTKIANGTLAYVGVYTNPDISLSEAGKRDGLAPVVNRGVTHVDITLPQILYDEVFNLK